MHTRIRNLLPVIALTTALVLAAAGCSKDDDNPTGPPGARELDSGNIGTGQRYVHTFANAGTYGYHCTIHPNMTSSITVAAGGLDSLIVLIVNTSNSGFQAQAVGGSTTVDTGGYVSWQNQSVTHTVTSH